MLNSPARHESLSHDLEWAVQKGLKRLAEFEDVQDIEHVEKIKELIKQANLYAQISSSYFQQWYINVAEDLIDEVELLLLTHGDDLVELGLKDNSTGTLLVLLALAELTDVAL